MATRAALGGLGLVLTVAMAGAAEAEVKDYQIRRMLMLKTECSVTSLAVSARNGKDLFSAGCENVAHYPDGVEIICPDTEDERECTILTAKREFRHLHHLKP